MDERDWLAERFEEHRARLRAVAYRMLGSLSEADDAVQEAWLRLGRADADGIENLGGWLTTVVARVCVDMLRARTLRSEEPLDTRVPGLSNRGHDEGISPATTPRTYESMSSTLIAVTPGPSVRTSIAPRSSPLEM